MNDAELVLRARGGDELAFRRLVDRHRDRISAIALKYAGKGLGPEDYKQEALIGFHKAVRDFRPEAGSRFSTFANLCIERQVITALKTAGRNKHEVLNQAASLSAPLKAESETTLDEALTDRRSSSPDPVELFEHREEIAELSDAIRERLSDFEFICLSAFANGFSYEEIAESQGVGIKPVDNALQRAQRKLAEWEPPGARSGQHRSYGYRCPSCGGATVKVRRRGRPPRCVVCRTSRARMAVAA